jgi:hypothetical protein
MTKVSSREALQCDEVISVSSMEIAASLRSSQ